MSAIRELDCVILVADRPGEKLPAGDIGTVIHVHRDGEAFEVEFVDENGRTVALVSLDREQIKPVVSG